MAATEQTPSPTLLRLRSADVVRLCGLAAAATGLDLTSGHNVIASRRSGNRLLATVNDDTPHAVWVDVPDDVDAAQWSCDCAQVGPLACAHVAAVLSAWIAHPSDFMAPAAETRADADSRGASQPEAAAGAKLSGVEASGGRPVPTGEGASLASALSRMNAGDVESLARRILASERAPELADVPREARHAITAALSDANTLQALLARLDESAQSLLTLLSLAGGVITTADLEAMSVRIARPLSAMQGDIAILERHLLLLPMLPATAPNQHGPGSSWRHVAGWRIPDEVRRAFVVLLPLMAQPAPGGGRAHEPLRAADEPPGRVLRHAPRTLCLALALLAAAPPPLGLPAEPALPGDRTNSTAQRSDSRSLTPGELAPDRLRVLARSAGLDATVVRLARRLLLQSRERHSSPAVASMARLPASERPVVLRAAFRRWVRFESAADLLDSESSADGATLRYSTTHPGFQPTTIASEVSAARRFVVGLLAHARPEMWYSLDEFTDLIWQIRPTLLRGQQQTWTTPVWWLESVREQRPLLPHLHLDWIRAEGAFVRSLFQSAFLQWGMVELATNAEGAGTAFRLTPFGQFLLQRNDTSPDAMAVAACEGDWGPPVLPLHAGALAVQPLAASANLLDALELWARPTAVHGKRLVYTLSPDRACAAFDRNLPPEALLSILRPLHGRAAERVANRLGAWHANWGQTRITAGFTLLEARDEATLAEVLAAAPDVAARCRRIGPALALAHPADAAVVRMALAKRGVAV